MNCRGEQQMLSVITRAIRDVIIERRVFIPDWLVIQAAAQVVIAIEREFEVCPKSERKNR